MRPSPKHLLARASDKARQSAAGTPVPAGQEPPAPEARPNARGRAAIRRRIRRLRRTRAVMVAELGELVAEMERLGRSNPDLVKRRAGEIVALDGELSGLLGAVGRQAGVEEIARAGIAGRCTGCATLMATDDRFCPSCGRPAGPPPPPTDDQPAEEQAKPVAAATPQG